MIGIISYEDVLYPNGRDPDQSTMDIEVVLVTTDIRGYRGVA